MSVIDFAKPGSLPLAVRQKHKHMSIHAVELHCYGAEICLHYWPFDDMHCEPRARADFRSDGAQPEDGPPGPVRLVRLVSVSHMGCGACPDFS